MALGFVLGRCIDINSRIRIRSSSIVAWEPLRAWSPCDDGPEFCKGYTGARISHG